MCFLGGKDTCCTSIISYAVKCSAVRTAGCVSSIVAGPLISSKQTVVVPSVNSGVFLEEMFLNFQQKLRRGPTC
jgi:hypothetical protein